MQPLQQSIRGCELHCLTQELIFCSHNEFSELRKLEGLALPPMQALFSESLNGVAVIRACEAQQYFLMRMELLIENTEKIRIAGAYKCFHPLKFRSGPSTIIRSTENAVQKPVQFCS